MKHKIIAYKRVSTLEQNLERQLDGIEFDKEFIEKESGAKSDNRPQLISLLDYVREDDVVYVHSIDRLARNLHDLESIIQQITDKGASITFKSEQLTFSSDTSNAMSKLMLQMMGAFAEFERKIIRERQAQGIAKAKKKGVYKGRAPALSDKEKQALFEDYKNLDMFHGSKERLAAKYGISRSTMWRYIKEQNSKSKTKPATDS